MIDGIDVRCETGVCFRIGSILSYRSFSRRQRRAAAVQRFPRSRGPYKLFV